MPTLAPITTSPSKPATLSRSTSTAPASTTKPSSGLADISLDGKKNRIDLFSPKKKLDHTAFTKDDFPLGFQTLRIEATGQKNESSKGSAITFNAANVQN